MYEQRPRLTPAPRTWAPILDRFVRGSDPADDPAVAEGRAILAARFTTYAHERATSPVPEDELEQRARRIVAEFDAAAPAVPSPAPAAHR